MIFFKIKNYLKNNGGIGGYLSSIVPQSSSDFHIGRFFYDNVSNIVIVIIMINIFAGDFEIKK